MIYLILINLSTYDIKRKSCKVESSYTEQIQNERFVHTDRLPEIGMTGAPDLFS